MTAVVVDTDVVSYLFRGDARRASIVPICSAGRG